MAEENPPFKKDDQKDNPTPKPYTPRVTPSSGGSNRPFQPNPNSSSSNSPRPFTPNSGTTSGPRPYAPSGGGGTSGPRPFTPNSGGPGGPRPNNRSRFVPREERLEHRINDMIRIPEARLVGDNLEEISGLVGETIETGVFRIAQLLAWSEKSELDLVEIVPNAQPPVVRIIDYNKFIYNKKRKEKEIKSSAAKTVLKEIRFGPNTDDHDFEFKTRHAIEFLKEGAKVKAYVQFKGRAIVFKDRGELLLLKFMKELEDVGVAEQMPKLEGRRMLVILSPKKTSKK